MAVSLSIKDVPDDLARALRQRALKNHRSIQGELMHILETTVRPRPFNAEALLERLEAIGVRSPAEGTAIIRRDRDSR
jgi:plasmid stability protein